MQKLIDNSTKVSAEDFQTKGKVLNIKDGIAEISGLNSAKYFEKIICHEKNIQAIILNLENFKVGAAVLGDYTKLEAGDEFQTSGQVMKIPVYEEILGTLVNGVGDQIIENPSTQTNLQYLDIEKIAPGVISRKPVDTPLQTGILAIDAATPIGKGQRQLIIGDRSTGKTRIALDAILNQKNQPKQVICIYVAIGQKNSKISEIHQILKETKAMDYSIIVNASAADSVVEQFFAPYTGTAIAEYFLAQGKDVLIIYDDLTKHAWAYRQISLTLRRPPGREAYPGDIFYLHSKLLERACRLNEANGNGSITALPIVETQFGDVSSYIPTNIISITDGQIYLDRDLFNSNIRPAIDVRNSVSRVGGAAQIKDMKKAAGNLRLDIANFKELEAFAQFGGSDIDTETLKKINKGKKTIELLKQNEGEPLPVLIQIALLRALNNGHFDEIEISKIKKVKDELVEYLDDLSEADQIDARVSDFFSTR
ncbi:MAG: F0F1 ATP synthase subunit alpha [Niabella sp.]|nr:MAG: F0F1 ATP synthase subunit alpha [Niabella sp.]